VPRRPTPRLISIFITTPVCCALTLAVVLGSADRALAGSGYFTSSANGARSSHGLSSYSVASDLSSIAQRHANAMAARRTIYHNSSLGSEACCWQSIGENVGSGQSDSQVQSAFMNSSPHRSNILSSTFNEIGVGTATGSDGQIYVDEVFRARMGSHGSAGHVTQTKTTHHSSGVVAQRPRRATSVAVAPRRLTPGELLARKLHAAARSRQHPPDPFAAAFSFSAVMSRLTH
jgi:hypothetical protein